MSNTVSSSDHVLNEIARLSFGVESKKDTLSGYYIFYSFDIVNSTEYKSKNRKEWPELFSHFYEYTKEEIRKCFKEIQLWKYVGDEILFFMKINKKEDFYDLCQKTLDVQRRVLKSINSKFEDSKGVLYIKSALWSADVKVIETGNRIDEDFNRVKENENERNLIFFHSNENGFNFDFLGPDIDIGFRISKFSEKNKLVICAELAYVLYKFRGQYEDKNNNRIEEQLKIISFEDLKGIWSGRKYPIIWFHDQWAEKANMYEYDERFTSQIVANIFSNNFKLEEVSFLNKVYADVDLKNKINSIVYNIDSGVYNTPFDSQTVAKNRAEVHCVSICIDNANRILIAKRKNKIVLNEKWEFGCGQISLDYNFETFLKDVYKNDFNVDISLFKEANEPIPIATYTLNKKEILIPGIIFVSKIEGEIDERNLRAIDKYSEVKLVSLEELESFEEGTLVPEMKRNAKKAIEIFNKINN
ncbi:hypothetical protein VO178_19325 [Lysinibacillus fusiformis]|uniref:hypothetical protein n=1 Tax=Lysinibacillus fusiformis TaxID=28031 RepID=UPI002D79CAC8|nr:hypothetical protein [Lysinibacillus fusiformis]WRS97506.1 hypothetical protein VO178_19325 [Lysinibacillus fusiformis]